MNITLGKSPAYVKTWLNEFELKYPKTKITYIDGSQTSIFCKETLKSNYIENKINVLSVEIGKAVTSVYGAFDGCSNLISVYIPDSVTSFNGCNNCISLSSIDIPNSVTFIAGFKNCTSLTSIVMPDSVTNIGALTFAGCTSINVLCFPDSVTEIGHGALSGCSNLELVQLPNSITYIGENMFKGCSRLTDIRIPNSVVTIDDYAFWNCSCLESVYMSKSIGRIGRVFNSWVFKDCTNLTEIHCYKSCQEKIENMQGYRSKWGASNATVYFDLEDEVEPEPEPEPEPTLRTYKVTNSVGFNVTLTNADTDDLTVLTNGENDVEAGTYTLTKGSFSGIDIGTSTYNENSTIEICSDIEMTKHTYVTPQSEIDAISNSVILPEVESPVSATYSPDDTVIKISLSETTGKTFNIPIFLRIDNDISSIIDYGDGTIETVGTNPTHTYADYGEYTIVIDDTVSEVSFNNVNGINSSSIVEVVQLGKSLTKLLAFCFFKCSNLTHIELPLNITTLCNGVLFGCTNLKTILSMNPTAPTIQANVFGVDSDDFRCGKNATDKKLILPYGTSGYLDDDSAWKSDVVTTCGYEVEKSIDITIAEPAVIEDIELDEEELTMYTQMILNSPDYQALYNSMETIPLDCCPTLLAAYQNADSDLSATED